MPASGLRRTACSGHSAHLDLPHRVVMAPLTRNRAAPGQVPTPLMAEYYGQRADPATGAGLLITEASQISQQGQGYLDTPGLFSAEQIRGWQAVTKAVHARGGRIVTQMWHVGRISHTSLQPNGGKPVAPSAVRAKSKTYLVQPNGAGGFEETSEPRALELGELSGIIAAYARAAKAAIEEAGFDGVELHAANGYLLEQFMQSASNQRTDAYGGSIANRTRLLAEVMQAVAGEIGGGRTGLRLSPVTPANDAAQALLTPSYDYTLATNFRPNDDYQADIRRLPAGVRLLAGTDDELFEATRFDAVFADAGHPAAVALIPGVNHIGLTLAPAAVQAVVRACAE